MATALSAAHFHNEEAAQKLEANTKAVRSAQGKLATAASENGVGGLSIAALSNELNANAGHYASDVQYNRDASDEEIRLQMQGIQTDAQSRLNNIRQPSLIGAAAKVGGDALSAVSTYFPTETHRSLQIPVDAIDDLPYVRAGLM